jgi:dihydroorotate dehydrogenase
MYKRILRPLLFLFDPESIHKFTFGFIRILGKIPGISRILNRCYTVDDTRLQRELFGLRFRNPVGLAAGFDKDAVLFDELGNFGFGFVEIGTVTPQAQPGNPRKRAFRLPKDKGLINRMGFNNRGVAHAVERLKRKRRSDLIIGGNIGKNTATMPADYTADYLRCFELLHPHVNYFVLNVSCPNVGSHAKLTDKDYLKELIGAVEEANLNFEARKPVLLKIAPDLNQGQLDEIIELVKETAIDGVIACNTSVGRDGLQTSANRIESIGQGGLSGKPISDKSTEVIRYLAEKSGKAFPIIGVGGIHSPEDALEKLKAGADLVQVYTGFIYEGPSLVRRINQSILTEIQY